MAVVVVRRSRLPACRHAARTGWQGPAREPLHVDAHGKPVLHAQFDQGRCTGGSMMPRPSSNCMP